MSKLITWYPYAVLAACEYEAIAIGSRGKIPTLSALCARWPVASPVVVAGLAAHLYLYWKAARDLQPSLASTETSA